MNKNPEKVNPFSRILINTQLKLLDLMDIVDRRGVSPSRNNRIALLLLRLNQKSEALSFAEQALPIYPGTYLIVAQRIFDLDIIPKIKGQDEEAGKYAAAVLRHSLDSVVLKHPSLEEIADFRFGVHSVLFSIIKRPRIK